MDKQYAKDFLKKYITVTGGPAAVDALDDENKAAKAKEFVKKYFTMVGGPEAIDAAAVPGPKPGPKYLTMTVGSTATQISIESTSSRLDRNIQYRLNDGDWTDWNFETSQPISANANDVIQWKGDNPDGLSPDYNDYIHFDIPNEVNLSGNVMSLIDGFGNTEVIPCDYCFYSLFNYTKIKTVSEDLLPATTLTRYCYSYMFEGCTSLENAPELPANTLFRSCYEGMFYECSSLVNVPKILPATTLAQECCYHMFEGCTSLENAPELPATTLVQECYKRMFDGCSNLKSVTCLATDISATDCTSSWLWNVASTGTFVKASGFNGWSTGGSGIPEGWTEVEK